MGQCGAFLQFLVDMVHFGGGEGGLPPGPPPPLPWTPFPLRSSNALPPGHGGIPRSLPVSRFRGLTTVRRALTPDFAVCRYLPSPAGGSWLPTEAVSQFSPEPPVAKLIGTYGAKRHEFEMHRRRWRKLLARSETVVKSFCISGGEGGRLGAGGESGSQFTPLSCWPRGIAKIFGMRPTSLLKSRTHKHIGYMCHLPWTLWQGLCLNLVLVCDAHCHNVLASTTRR